MSQQLKELGTLVVVVLKAQHLHQPSFYKQSPYVQVSLSGQKKRTKVDSKGGQHPVWDDELRFPVLADIGNDKVNRTLEISCYKDEQRGDDILLGKGTVNIEETLKTGEFDDWVSLETSAGARGEVYLEMTFYANSPPPLMRRPSKLSPFDRLTRPAAYFAQGQQPGLTSTSPSPQRRASLIETKPSQTSPTGVNKIPSSLIPARGATSQASRQAPFNGSTTAVVSVKHKNDSLPALPADNDQHDIDSRENSRLPAALHPGGGSGLRPMPPPNRARVTSTGRPPPEILPEALHRRTLSDTPVVAPSPQLQVPMRADMTGQRIGSTPSIVIEEHIEDPPGLPFPVPLAPPQGFIQQHESRNVYVAGNYDSFSYGPPEQLHMQSNSPSYTPIPAQGYSQTFSRSSSTPSGQAQQAYDASLAVTSPLSLPQHYSQYPGGTPTPRAPSAQAYPPLPQQAPYSTQARQHLPFHQQSYSPPQQQQYHPQHLPYTQSPHPPNVSQPFQQSSVAPPPQQPLYSQVSQQPQQSYFVVPPPPPLTIQPQTPRPYAPQPTPQLQSYFSPPPPPPPPIQLHNQGVKSPSPVHIGASSQPPVPPSTPSQAQIPPPTSSVQSITPVSQLTQSPTATSTPLPVALNNAPTSSTEEVVQQRQVEKGGNEAKSIEKAETSVQREVGWTPQDTVTNISKEQNTKIVEDERGQLEQLKDAGEQVSHKENESSQCMKDVPQQRGEEELREQREERQEEQKRQELEHRRREEGERKKREEEERREMEAEERRREEEELKRKVEERREREEEERRVREQELKRRDEEERQRREEEERRRREEEARRKRLEELRREEEECRRREEEERAKEEEERRRREEEERRRREEEERRRREEQERRRREEEERAKREEERRRGEEERRRREEEEAVRRCKIAEQEARRHAEQVEAEKRWQEELARIRARAEQEAADEAFARAQMEAEEVQRRKQEEADMEVARREQAHEEVLERRRQEERRRRLEETDRELARRLDMELNLGRDQSRQGGASGSGRR